MAAYTDDLIQIALTKETIRGTVVNASAGDSIRAFDIKIEEKVNKKEDKSNAGNLAYSESERVTTKEYMLKFKEDVRRKNFGKYFMSVLGQVTTQANVPQTGVQTHTFTRNDVNLLPTYSIAYKDPNQTLQFGRSVVNKLKISFKPEDYLVGEVDTMMVSRNSAGTFTPAYQSADSLFTPSMATVKIASTFAGLGGATAVSLGMFDMEIDRGAKVYYVLGQQEGAEIVSSALKVTGKIQLLYLDTSYKAVAEGDSVYNAISLTLTDTTTTIGASTNPAITITIPKASIKNFKTSPKAEWVEQEFEFTAMLDYTNGDVSVVVVNDVTGY